MKSQSMHLRGNCILVGFVLLGLLITGAEAGVQITLGGTTGWTNEANIDYTKWISSFNIKVGDTLVFDNNDVSDHSVLKVDEAGYDACDASAAISITTLSPEVPLGITFLEPGWRYFICGNPGHCVQGQKVNFDVLNADGTKNTTTSLSNPNTSAASPRVDRHPALTWLAPLGLVALVNAASFFFF